MAPFDLPRDEVHVWSVPLDACAAGAAGRAGVLDAAERERAAALWREADRRRWSTCRVAVRLILSGYLGEAPERLRFAAGPRGKPALDGPWAGPPLQFNLSHSVGLAALAVTRACPVGVDVECVRPVPDFAGIVRRYFSPAERRAFDRVRPAEQLAAFFTCWTRKEAVVKALGEGFFRAPDRFDVTFAPGEPARVLAFHDPPDDAASWALHALDLESPAVGCVALPSAGPRVRQMVFSDL
jgi:4'-phosphopantetheinyl transferase